MPVSAHREAATARGALALLAIVVASCGLTAGASAGTRDADGGGDPTAGATGDAEPRPDPDRPAIAEHVEVRERGPDADDPTAFTVVVEPGETAGGRGADLGDLLRRVAGARVSDYGGLGSYSTVSLRAATGEQVTVLVDGVPQNSALGGPVDLSWVPATQVERITVFPSFGPATLGLGGIGGVIDVRTKRPGDERRVDVDLLAGELGTRRASTALELPLGDGGAALRLGAEHLHSDGDFVYLDTGATPFTAADDVQRTHTNNDVEQSTTSLRLDAPAGPGELDLALRVQRRERGLPGVDGFPAATARTDGDRQELVARWRARLDGAVDELELQADTGRQRLGFRDLDGEIGVGPQDQTTRIDGGGLTAVVRGARGRHHLLGRVELRAERARVAERAVAGLPVAGADRRRVDLTVEDRWVRGRLIVAPALHWERLRDERAGPAGGAVPDGIDAGEWSGKLGLAWRAGPRWTVRGSAGRFNRNPSLLELFGDRGTVAGNPALRPERGTALEAGFERTAPAAAGRPAWALRLAGFARRVEDLIHLMPVAQGTVRARNVSRAEVLGADAVASIAPGGAWPTLELGGTWQRTRDASAGPFEGARLPYQPDLLGFVALDWQRGPLEIDWELTHVGDNGRDRLDTPAFRLPARTIHDARIGWRRPDGLRVGLDVRNLFDRQVVDVARFPLPGRVVLLHVGWHPGRPR